MSRSEAIERVLTELRHAEGQYPPFATPDALIATLEKQVADLKSHVRGDGDLEHDLPQIAVAAMRGLMCCETLVRGIDELYTQFNPR